MGKGFGPLVDFQIRNGRKRELAGYECRVGKGFGPMVDFQRRNGGKRELAGYKCRVGKGWEVRRAVEVFVGILSTQT